MTHETAHEFLTPNHIIYGEGALEKSSNILCQIGKKAMIVTDKMMRKIGNDVLLTKMLDELKIEYVFYDQITGEPTDKMICEGEQIYKKEKCDCFIALGGGSVIDSMKAIGAAVTYCREISSFKNRIVERKLPNMAAIPTTAGTGSEVTQFTIITDTANDVKMLIKGSALVPDIAVVDPRFTLSMPKYVTASTGIDALTHAIEAYLSNKSNTISDMFALNAIDDILKYLPLSYANGNDIAAREKMSVAAMEAGIAFNNSSVTVVHGLSRPIGALFHVAHGISNAMLLEKCLRYIADDESIRKRLGEIGKRTANFKNSDEDAADCFIDTVKEICKICEIPSLREYGIDEKEYRNKIDKMVKDAMESKSPQNLIKRLDEDDLKNIYESLWTN